MRQRLTALALACHVVEAAAALSLVAFSTWFIAACAVAGHAGLVVSFNYVVPATVIRLLAILRIAAGYGSRYAGHLDLLRRLADVRARAMAAVLDAPRPPRRAQTTAVLQQASEDFAARVDTVIAPQLAAALLLAGSLLAFTLLLPALLLPWLALVALLAVLRTLYKRVAGRSLMAADEKRQALDAELDRWLRVSSLWSLRPAWIEGAAAMAGASAYARARRRADQLQAQLDGLLLLLGLAAASALAHTLADAPATPLHVVPLMLLATLRDWTLPAFAAVSRGEATALSAGLLPAADARPARAGRAAPGPAGAAQTLSLRDAHWLRGDRPGPRLSAELTGPGVYLLSSPSGVGKSSLFLGLCGELPLAGEVRFNGQPIDDLSPPERRARFYLAEQFPHVLSDTLAHNLRLAAPQASDEALRAALAWACLEDLESPGGLSQWLGSEGRPLSGGERKRLGLARARLTDAPVWLLDEPFEGVDPERRRILAERLNDEGRRRLIIVAAHRAPAALAPDGNMALGAGGRG